MRVDGIMDLAAGGGKDRDKLLSISTGRSEKLEPDSPDDSVIFSDIKVLHRQKNWQDSVSDRMDN